MWKLNQSYYADLPDSWRDDPSTAQDVGQLQNWRRRVCYLEQLKSFNALCMTYISEKSDSQECVANILACIEDGSVKSVASVRRLTPITCLSLTAEEEEKIKYSCHQYDIAITLDTSHIDDALPSTLYGFQVVQSDGSEAGQAQNIFAFDNKGMCDSWLAAIEAVSQKLTKYTDLPALRLVQ